MKKTPPFGGTGVRGSGEALGQGFPEDLRAVDAAAVGERGHPERKRNVFPDCARVGPGAVSERIQPDEREHGTGNVRKLVLRRCGRNGGALVLRDGDPTGSGVLNLGQRVRNIPAGGSGEFS